MVFNANLNSSYDSRQKKSKTRVFLLIMVGLLIAGYFLVPKFLKFNSAEKTAQTIESNATLTESQIVKEIELPKLEEIKH
ncbi:hypothetical protein [Candidatus Marithrix sp. Canyon 246]|uniref:hypothetical protein n=1 Tax=Candidatus Marithrix sp. Canyon 246 TaxID=1827136 RepID=UPI00084A025C|nr:hypothetical protein [Candidatus Marithrix sp. Canyon 246]